MCSHCRRVDLPKPIQHQLGKPFFAVYAGKCSACGDRFDAMHVIRADGQGGYIHADCGEDQT